MDDRDDELDDEDDHDGVHQDGLPADPDDDDDAYDAAADDGTHDRCAHLPLLGLVLGGV